MTIAINPGQLRDPISFYKLSLDANESGGSKKVELFAFKTFGAIKKMKAFVNFADMRKELNQAYEITIRWSNGHIPKTDMIMYDNYQVRYIVNEITETDTVRRLITFMATKEIVDDES